MCMTHMLRLSFKGFNKLLRHQYAMFITCSNCVEFLLKCLPSGTGEMWKIFFFFLTNNIWCILLSSWLICIKSFIWLLSLCFKRKKCCLVHLTRQLFVICCLLSRASSLICGIHFGITQEIKGTWKSLFERSSSLRKAVGFLWEILLF